MLDVMRTKDVLKVKRKNMNETQLHEPMSDWRRPGEHEDDDDEDGLIH